ncbi:MAG: hypothetical protein ABFE07_23885 [Armatimonadia bacterium]
METLTLEEVRELTAEREGPFISLYLPTDRSGTATGGNGIRFKNMLRRAEQLLSRQGLKERPIKALLDAAWHLQADRMFWEYQSEGLACFIARDFMRYYRLPLSFPELVTANQRFHLKPLLNIVGPTGSFYILALSKHQTRVFYCTINGARELTVPDLPPSLDYTLRFDELERQFLEQEMHTAPGSISGNRTKLMFHGHGMDDERAQEDLMRYFHEIDNALQKLLHTEQAPLVLAGVDYMIGLFRRASRYANIAEDTISGNFERTLPEELHTRGWHIVQPIFLRARQVAVERFEHASAYRRASTEVREVVIAAHDGLVEAVFLPVGQEVWGRFDPVTRRVAVHEQQGPDDEDLLDLIATEVLRTGGDIWAVDRDQMPTTALAAAVLRYPVSGPVLEEAHAEG